MDNSLFQSFVPDEQAGQASLRPASARAGFDHGVADTEENLELEEGFPWYRIRRLPKKG